MVSPRAESRQRSHKALGAGKRHAHPDLPFAIRIDAELPLQRFLFRQRPARKFQAAAARRRRLQRIPAALEQLHLQAVLQIAQKIRERRLRDIQLLCRARKAAMPADRIQIDKVLQIHCVRLP